MIPNEISNQSQKKIDKTKYRSTIGKLLYLAISTRPDNIYAVGKCSRKSNNPTPQNWSNVIKILMYLKNTINYGIYFNKNNCIKAFLDANFAGDSSSRRSTSGYIIKIDSAPISWSSKLQHCVINIYSRFKSNKNALHKKKKKKRENYHYYILCVLVFLFINYKLILI